MKIALIVLGIIAYGLVMWALCYGSERHTELPSDEDKDGR